MENVHRKDCWFQVIERNNRCSLLRAMRRGYIKTLDAIHVEPQQLAFIFQDSLETTSLCEVLKLSEDVWLSRCLSLSEPCNRSVVASSVQACNDLRQLTGRQHQIIGAACSVPHAQAIAELYRELGYRAEPIHNERSKVGRRKVLQRLRDGNLAAIVQVQLLDEEFCDPKPSIAAIFRPFRSLSRYMQMVKQITCVMEQNSPLETCNRGAVVTHVGLNSDRHWEQFEMLVEEDQNMVAGLLNGILNVEHFRDTDLMCEEDVSRCTGRFFSPEMLAEWESLESSSGHKFLDFTFANLA